MPYIHFDDNWHYNNCRLLRIESDLLRIEILPEIGGKTLRWIHKPLDRDYLWQNPRVLPRPVPTGTNYDDHWAGGWDELFPNGGACRFEGESYPDHGEYWTRPCTWQAETSDREVTLYLRLEGAASPTRYERWLTVTAGSPVVRIRRRVTNLGRHGFHYLWAQHPGLNVQPGWQLLIPAGKGIVASPGLGRFATEPLEFTWPHVPAKGGGTVDFSRIPTHTPEPGYEMVYLTEMHAGWFATFDPAARAGFGVTFDPQLFNSTWVFQTHGGWRGLHVANIEPATGYPYQLPDAAATGRCAYLAPGQVLETTTTVVVFTDRDSVTGIDPDGTIH